ARWAFRASSASLTARELTVRRPQDGHFSAGRSVACWRSGLYILHTVETRGGRSMSGASKRVRSTDRQRLSRRQFIGAAAAGAAAALGSGPAAAVLSAQAPQVAGASARPQADVTLVLVNGRIHTMDGRNTVARTVSIRNG